MFKLLLFAFVECGTSAQYQGYVFAVTDDRLGKVQAKPSGTTGNEIDTFFFPWSGRFCGGGNFLPVVCLVVALTVITYVGGMRVLTAAVKNVDELLCGDCFRPGADFKQLPADFGVFQ